MNAANYMQRVGASSCIRCDFKTDVYKSFPEQDEEMMKHLVLHHPNWMFDGVGAAKNLKAPTIKDRILEMFPGAVEMPDASGAPSADYCIVRPATKEDWPENKWVQIDPYVGGDPWDAAWEKLNPEYALDEMVRDFTTLGKCSKSEVRRRIKEHVDKKVRQDRMYRLGITEQDIAESMPPKPWENGR